MSKNVKVIIIVGLVIAVAALSVGYAALSQQLNISGTATVNANEWGIAFQTASCTKTGNATFTAPDVSGTTATLNDITLSLPGDSVTCTIQVKNTGTINAKLINYEVTGPTINPETNSISDFIKYSVTYDGVVAPLNNDEKKSLNAKETKNIVIKFEFTGDKQGDISWGDISISDLTVKADYQQA